MRSGTPLWVTSTTDVAGVGDAFAKPYNQVSDPNSSANRQFSQGVANGAGLDQNFWFDPAAFARPPGTFGNGPRNNIYNPGQYQWDMALFKNVRVQGRGPSSCALRCSTS